jgi:hypothetical protein
VYILVAQIVLLNLLIARLSKTYETTERDAKLESRVMFAQRVLVLETLGTWLQPLRLHKWGQPTNVGKQRRVEEESRYYYEVTSRDVFQRMASYREHEREQREQKERDATLLHEVRQLAAEVTKLRFEKKECEKTEVTGESSSSGVLAFFSARARAQQTQHELTTAPAAAPSPDVT